MPLIRRHCFITACAAALAACAPAGAAQKPATADSKLPKKALTAALGRDLLLAARGAARLGIRHLKARHEKEELTVWVAPQSTHKRIQTGWKTVTVTRPVYKTVTKLVPIVKTVGHKWVWKTEKDPKDPYAPAGRKRVRVPIRKVVGRRPEKRRVRDGNKTK
jgi:hypothetical protein